MQWQAHAELDCERDGASIRDAQEVIVDRAMDATPSLKLDKLYAGDNRAMTPRSSNGGVGTRDVDHSVALKHCSTSSSFAI